MATDITPRYPTMRCKHCDHRLRVELRLVAAPFNSASLTGVHLKTTASEWPFAVCDGCGRSSRGQRS